MLLVPAALLLAAWAGVAAVSRNTDSARAVANAPARVPLRHPVLPRNVTNTRHYRIYSSASNAQTAQVASAVEVLYQRYAAVFPPPSGKTAKLTLVLYRDRAEFKRNNQSHPWAEAYYLPPRCYAYFDGSARNPYHWMLHEATHQLMREVSGSPRVKWIDEGIAAYFGASRLVDGSLRLGDPDPDAYPIWWLGQFRLSGALDDDIASGMVIPLDRLLDGKGGPDMNRYFNQYYIHYWSLSQFLFHYRGGVYAERYKQLIAAGGTAQDFRRLIGPPERIQREWYAYLLALQQDAMAPGAMVPYRSNAKRDLVSTQRPDRP